MHVIVNSLCLTLFNPMDCSLPDSSTHGILQARILGWVAISFSRGSSQPRDWTQVSCIAGRFFISWATRKAQWHHIKAHIPWKRLVHLSPHSEIRVSLYSPWKLWHIFYQTSSQVVVLTSCFQYSVLCYYPHMIPGFLLG